MSAAPITTPSLILSTACFAALAVLVNSLDGIPAVYWQRAPGPGPAAAILAGTLPGCLAVQAPADLVGAGWVGEASIDALLIVKAFAASDDAAQLLLASAVDALGAGIAAPAAPSAPLGYAIALAWLAEIPLPPLDGIHTAAARYRATLRRV